MVGLIGFLHMERVAVGVGVDGDRLDAQFGARAHDADSDLAPLATSIFLSMGSPDVGRLGFFDKKNAKSYHCWLMFNRVCHV